MAINIRTDKQIMLPHTHTCILKYYLIIESSRKTPLGMVAPACYPSYSRSRGRRIEEQAWPEQFSNLRSLSQNLKELEMQLITNGITPSTIKKGREEGIYILDNMNKFQNSHVS